MAARAHSGEWRTPTDEGCPLESEQRDQSSMACKAYDRESVPGQTVECPRRRTNPGTAKGIVRLKTVKRSPPTAQLDLLPGEYSFSVKGLPLQTRPH